MELSEFQTALRNMSCHLTHKRQNINSQLICSVTLWRNMALQYKVNVSWKLSLVMTISLVKQVSFQLRLSKSGHDYQPDPLIRTQPRHPGFRVTLHDMGIDEACSAISRGQYNEIGPNADHLAYETAEDSIMQLSQVPAVAGKINSGNDVAPPSTGYRKLNQSIAYQGRPLSCLCFVLIYKFGLLLPVGVIQKISANLWC